jgi:hypothetical protein
VPFSSEATILDKIVFRDNLPDPPCRYTAIKRRDGSYAVTTTSIRNADRSYDEVTAVLDTTIPDPPCDFK